MDKRRDIYRFTYAQLEVQEYFLNKIIFIWIYLMAEDPILWQCFKLSHPCDLPRNLIQIIIIIIKIEKLIFLN